MGVHVHRSTHFYQIGTGGDNQVLVLCSILNLQLQQLSTTATPNLQVIIKIRGVRFVHITMTICLETVFFNKEEGALPHADPSCENNPRLIFFSDVLIIPK